MANLRVGKPDVSPDAPSHTPGVRGGNEPGGIEKDPGLIETRGTGRGGARATARRSTGINPGARNPIDPGSPNLPPA